MTASVAFLADLTVALAAAMVLGALASRLRLNPILGYLAAGILIGPSTPGYVARADTLETLATLGLIFLLFSIGLGFSFHEIQELGVRGIAGNLLATAAVGAVAGLGAAALHLPHPFTLGLVATVSSTAVGAALLRTWDIERAPSGRFAVSQLVVQDLAAVALLVVATQPATQLSPRGVLLPVAIAVGFVAIALVLGATVIHRAVTALLARASSEALFGTVAALALGSAWLGYLAGLSFEFGAFVAGAVISEAAGSAMVATVVAPFRALFVALFFVSVGMLLDPRAFAAHWPLVAGLGVAFTVVRFGLWAGLARAMGIASGGALLAGVALTALGEFNVVLIDGALRAGRLSAEENQLLLGVTFVSIALCAGSGSLFERWSTGDARAAVPVEGDAARESVAIVGFGRVGQTAATVLRHAGVSVLGLESDRATVDDARQRGFAVVLGACTDPVALDRVVTTETKIVLVTVPESAESASAVARIAERTQATLIVRAAGVREAAMLRERGATLALVPEAEGALVFAAAVLRRLGRSEAAVESELAAMRERSPLVARSESVTELRE